MRRRRSNERDCNDCSRLDKKAWLSTRIRERNCCTDSSDAQSGEPPWAASEQSSLLMAPPLRSLRRAGTSVVFLVALAIVCTAAHFGAPAHANEPGESQMKFDIDDPPETDMVITPSLTYGVEIDLTVEHAGNFDLDRNVGDNVSTIEPQLILAFTFSPTEVFRGYLELELTAAELLDAPESTRDPPTSLELKQIYWAFPYFIGGFSLQLGRQEFQDEREWLYDEDLDAIRIFVNASPVGFELSASRDRFLDRDLLNDEPNPKINRYLAMARYAITDESEANAYVLAQDDNSEDDEDIVFAGVHSSGTLLSNLDYWLEASIVRGESRGSDIKGYGFDIGATYQWDAALSPSITLGTAYGSGDADPSNDVDRNFRQTGVHDNEATFGGLTTFKHYGETLDPELSNITILTAGVGLRPTPESSIDLVYHYYRQNKALDELRDTNIEMEPNGIDRELGHGLDLVVAYHEVEDLELKFVLGGFLPGNAFPAKADPAYFASLEVTYGF